MKKNSEQNKQLQKNSAHHGSRDDARDDERNRFIEKLLDSGKIKLDKAQREQIQALPSDASTRRYFRIFQPQQNMLLMDAPPTTEKPAAFIEVAQYLRDIGLRAPKVYRADLARGFLLIEDFGDNSFTKLLDAGARQGENSVDEISADELYQDAITVLLHILQQSATQKSGQKSAVKIPRPTNQAEFWGAELQVFCDYYYPALFAQKPEDKMQLAGFIEANEAWQKCWQQIFQSLPSLPQVIVLRDCHVDNLIRVSDESAAGANEQQVGGVLRRCGLLDFQDAVIGSPAYDLVSLLEDARRDLAPKLREKLLAQYLAGGGRRFERADFLLHYQVWAAQRHARVLGTFARLALRDGKQGLTVHIPRVFRLLQDCLARDAETSCLVGEAWGDGERGILRPILRPLAEWFERYLPDHEERLTRCLSGDGFRVAE